MKKEEVDALLKILWEYQLMHQQLEKADVIIVLGSHDIRVAEYAAQLFLDGWAPRIVFSGAVGRFTEHWTKPEAEVFADAAIKKGVPKEKILIENRSTNTGENIQFTKALLDKENIYPKKVILVHKPYMERRAYATFKKQLPDIEVIVTSPQIPFDKYEFEDRPREQKPHVIVGDMQRVLLYGERGFILPQVVPSNVRDAFDKLVKAGYTSQLIT